MNAYANHMVSYLFAQSWQIAVLAGMVGLISLALKNRSAHLRYLLWLIVLAKCLVPPFLTIPLAVLPERSSSPSVAGVTLPEEHSALESPVSVGGATQPQQLKPTVPSVRELIALVWAAGAFLFLLWVGARTVRYTSWLRDRRRPLPPALQESIQELSMGFKFRKQPRIWLLKDISQPFVWGVLRGSVYLPADFVGLNGCVKSSTGILPVRNKAEQGQDGPATHGQDAHATTNRFLKRPLSGSDRQRSILAHELSHVARFDAGVNLLQVLAQAVYWFHPFVWWANRKMRQEREKCCDEMAVAHLKTPPERYTGAIVDALATERRSAHPIPSLAVVGSVRDIEERIKTMLKPGKTFRTRPSVVAATVALLIAFVTIPTALVLTARGEAQPATQSVDKPAQLPNKPAADSEKPEQPRFAARTFNSELLFDVFVQETGDNARRPIGRTPSAAPVQIPACMLWLVQPTAPVVDWDLLIGEINKNSVPGLRLEQATDSDLGRLAGLTALEFLDLTNAPVTDGGLAHLKDLPGLWGLDLSGSKITGPGLEHLKGLTGLQWLGLEGTPVTDAGLYYLKELRGLRRVNLMNTKITGPGLEFLRDLPELQRLRLANTQVTDAGLVHLRGLTRLIQLGLANTQVTDAGLEHLKGLAGLQQLNLSDTKMTDSGLANLAGLTGLETLWLDRTQTTDAGLSHLKSLTRLQWLNLSGTRITDVGLEHLKGLTGLWNLYLSNTRITGTGLVHLQGLPELYSLWLNNTQITDTGLVHLKGLTRLTRLDLSGTKVTDASLEHLKTLSGLRVLILNGTQITDAGAQLLKQSIPNLWIGKRKQAQ